MRRWILFLGFVLIGIAPFVEAGEKDGFDTARAAGRFKVLDGNEDGKLTTEELPESMRSAYPLMDANDDGAVSRREFAAYLAKKSAEPRPEEHLVHGFLLNRFRERSRRNLRAQGGGTKTEAAVELGLSWLARHQAETGEWSAVGSKEHAKKEKCSGPGTAEYDVVSTSLALLAFLSAGDTELTGKRRTVVKSGFDWLASLQAESGRIGPASERLYFYDHAAATIAMIEAYAMTGNPSRKASAERAYRFLLEARRPGGGWGAGPRAKTDDAGVTLWALLAIRSARMSRLATPAATLVEIRDRVKGWMTATPEKNAPLFPHSAWQVGAGLMFFREGWRHSWGGFRKDPAVVKLVEELPKRKTVGDRYLGTMGLFMHHGDPFRWWNLEMHETLLPRQITKGCAAGSWDPADFGEKQLGRVGVTACLTLCLEVYYRYGYCL